jgi:hypothetical protein
LLAFTVAFAFFRVQIYYFRCKNSINWLVKIPVAARSTKFFEMGFLYHVAEGLIKKSVKLPLCLKNNADLF